MNTRTPEEGPRVKHLRALVGRDVLLIPWPLGFKATRAKWGHLTLGELAQRKYLARLERGNIGVATGAKSGGLCSIDFDEPANVEPFLALNPRLKNTLRTRGKRGCNLWVRFNGEFPPSFDPKTVNGRKLCEFRADGRQTIISGQHPSGVSYAFEVEAPPVVLSYAEIHWHENLQSLKEECVLRTSAHETSSTLLHPTCSTPLHALHALYGKGSFDETFRAISEKKKFDERHPNLIELYARIIDRFHSPESGRRNAVIVAAAPFLIRAVSKKVGLILLAHFYNLNSSFFEDSFEQHMAEVEAALNNAEARAVSQLLPDEQKLYDHFAGSAELRSTFLICRDLAIQAEPAPPTFFLSCQELGRRIGVDDKTAWRILKEFRTPLRILVILRLGFRWASGQKPVATHYLWRLPLPSVSPK